MYNLITLKSGGSPIKQKLVMWVGIISLFIIALCVRLPYLDSSLNRLHEWITAHSLIILQNWEEQGASKHKFRLLMSFPGENNRGIRHEFMKIMDNEGYGYYTSFPPGSMVVAYATCKLFSIPLTIISIKILNIIFHFVSAIFFYFILRRFFCQNQDQDPILFLGMVFFILQPTHLWFFSNTYSWDIFWFYAWIANLFIVLNLEHRLLNQKPYRSSLLLLFLSLFLLIYSDFYSLLYSFALIWVMRKKFPSRQEQKQFVTVVLGAVFSALFLAMAQYCTIAGPQALFYAFFRSSGDYKFRGWIDIEQIINHFEMGYSLIILAAIFLAACLAIQEKKSFFKIFSAQEKTILALTFFPPMILYCLDLNWAAAHSYSTLRLSPFFIFLFLILVIKIWSRPTFLRKFIFAVSVLFAITTNINIYNDKYTFDGRGDFYKRMGESMKLYWRKGEVAFSINNLEDKVDPRILYYFRQNVKTVKDRQAALEKLSDYEKAKGIIFYLDEQKGLVGYERVRNPESDETNLINHSQ